MIKTGKDIERLLAEILEHEGFRKNGRTWRLHTPEVTEVVNLQKSRWSDAYYLNLGILVNAIEAIPQPKEYQCHARIRLCEIAPDRLRCDALFDLADSTIDPKGREREIAAAMRKCALPLLAKCRTLNGLRAAIDDHPTLAYAVELRKIVGQIG